jgi:hypothetical protein
MVAQATVARTRKAAQPPAQLYKPHVRIVDAERGLYTVQSETYTYVLYGVTVHEDGRTSCECTAGEHGRDCKHAKAVRAYVAYRAHPSHLRPPAPTFAELAQAFAQLPAPSFDFRVNRPAA